MRDRILILCSWLLITIWAIIPDSLTWVAAIALGMITLYSAMQERFAVFQTTLFFSIFFTSPMLFRTNGQVSFGIAILIYVLTFWIWDAARPQPWWQRGEINRAVVALTAASAIVSGTTLVAWFLLLKPDVSDIILGFIPQGYPLSILFLGGVAFSIVNAFLEEFAYRGVLTSGFEYCGFGPAQAIVLQAVSFGLLHVHGFPRGWLGVGLAFFYGVMMGSLRYYSRGMLAPWAGHVFVDITIVSILLFMAI